MADISKETSVSANPTTQQPTSLGVTSPTSPTTSIPLSPVISPDRRGDDRRGSDEWDASKVPPSRFQKRKGSIYAVPSSRDSRVDHSYTEKYDQKLAELGYGRK